MGEIWLAHHRGPAGFERLVVLKRIITGPDDDPSMLSMFLDEARIVSQLHHPNVVQVTELGQDGPSFYLAMEYLAGQTLSRIARRLFERQQAVPTRFALEVIRDAARGLGYAHRRRGPDGKRLEIVHRDVSPQNILVTYEGQTKVLDFGIATAMGRGTRTSTGILKGKVAYMSPEQALGQKLGPQADVFALGTVLFELVSASRLHQGADDIAILRRLMSGEPLPRVTQRVRVDARLDALIASAMAWDVADRFEDGEVLADAIERLLRQMPAGVNELSPREVMHDAFATEVAQLPELNRVVHETPSKRSSDSLPSKAIPADGSRARRGLLAAAAVLLLLAGATVALLSSRQADGQPPPSPAVAMLAPAAERAPLVVEPPPPTAPVDAGASAAVEAVADAGAVAVAPPAADAGAAGSADARVRSGKVSLQTEPWTKVFYGKRLLGETPLFDVALPAGRQRLRLVNPDEGIDTVIEVEVPGNGTVAKRLVL
ncbi:MAG: serine/threonine protein kinase [Myxococcaceae bacterium]|nr:serine/threonine protein kinase [Myxococcaceae bacterium]